MDAYLKPYVQQTGTNAYTLTKQFSNMIQSRKDSEKTTWAELAVGIGYSGAFLSNLVNGKRQARLETVQKLIAAFGESHPGTQQRSSDKLGPSSNFTTEELVQELRRRGYAVTLA